MVMEQSANRVKDGTQTLKKGMVSERLKELDC